jgi:hypothetical protein
VPATPTPINGLIFISYRHDDCNAAANFLAGKLAKEYGRRRVYIDKARMQGGDAFRVEIEAALRQSAVVLALIGPHWEDLAQSRMGKATDVVRAELLQAIDQTNSKLIPILVDREKFRGVALSRHFQDDPDALRIIGELSGKHQLELKFGVPMQHNWLQVLMAKLREHLGWQAFVNQRLRQWLHPRLGYSGNVDDVWALARRTNQAVERTTALGQLQTFWRAGERRIIVHGKEGSGKSVLVAQWLKAVMGAESELEIVVASSREVVNSGVRDWRSLIKILFAKPRLNMRAARSSFLRSSGLVVLDGINESGAPAFWHELLRAPLPGNLRILVTTRSQHRADHRADLFKAFAAQIIVNDFSDPELDAALVSHQLAQVDIGSDVLKVMRRPRYFGRAVAHHEKMGGFGALTRELLILVDWQSRRAERSGNPSFGDYQSVLLNFAKKLRKDAQATLVKADLLNALPLDADDVFTAKLAEFRQQDCISLNDLGQFVLEKSLLPMALGFDLLKELRALTDSSFKEVITRALGDQQDDLRAQLLSCAINAAVVHEDQVSDTIVEALFCEWLSAQNRGHGGFQLFARLFALRAEACLNVIEAQLLAGYGPHMRSDFLSVLHHVADTSQAGAVAVLARVGSWVGYFSLGQNHSEKPDNERVLERPELAQLAREIDPGLMEVNERKLECRQLALGFLSVMPKFLTSQHLIRAALAIVIHPSTWDWQTYQWLMRFVPLTHQELTQALTPLKAASANLQRWLHRLLSSALCT